MLWEFGTESPVYGHRDHRRGDHFSAASWEAGQPLDSLCSGDRRAHAVKVGPCSDDATELDMRT